MASEEMIRNTIPEGFLYKNFKEIMQFLEELSLVVPCEKTRCSQTGDHFHVIPSMKTEDQTDRQESSASSTNYVFNISEVVFNLL